jgi:hypothetical protein
MKKTFLIFCTLIQTFLVYAQRTGGVCIADSMKEAHESAMLHIISTNKGLLLPTVTVEERDNIKPLSVGLTVFVNDNDEGGFQFWNGTKWIGLEVINDKKIAMIAPLGGIIMYHGNFNNFDPNGKGLTGTEMEGWQLCNGKNGAPDLSSKFVVGGGRQSELDNKDTKYRQIGNSGNPAKELVIDATTMPPHTHTVSESVTIKHSHTHDVASSNDYEMKGVKKTYDNSHSHVYNTKIKGSRKKGGDFSRKNSQCGVFGGKACDVETDYLMEEVDLNNISVDSKTVNVEFTVDSKAIRSYDGMSSIKFDNRPRYYVLAYIIRIDDNIDNGGYGGKYTINYEE